MHFFNRFFGRIYFFIFLIIAIVALFFMPLVDFFLANIFINGLILFVFIFGLLFALQQMHRLKAETKWVVKLVDENQLDEDVKHLNVLRPLHKNIVESSQKELSFSTNDSRFLLEAIDLRLSESKDISRYIINLLVFLGLLGTFWGLLLTISSISEGLSANTSNSDILGIIESLFAQLQGLETAFSSSLFGLASSLILGFIDMQKGQAESRFFVQIEEFIVERTNKLSALHQDDFGVNTKDIFNLAEQNIRNTNQITAALPELTNILTKQMQTLRNEQKIIAELLSLQQENNKDVKNSISSLKEVNSNAIAATENNITHGLKFFNDMKLQQSDFFNKLQSNLDNNISKGYSEFAKNNNSLIENFTAQSDRSNQNLQKLIQNLNTNVSKFSNHVDALYVSIQNLSTTEERKLLIAENKPNHKMSETDAELLSELIKLNQAMQDFKTRLLPIIDDKEQISYLNDMLHFFALKLDSIEKEIKSSINGG